MTCALLFPTDQFSDLFGNRRGAPISVASAGAFAWDAAGMLNTFMDHVERHDWQAAGVIPDLPAPGELVSDTRQDQWFAEIDRHARRAAFDACTVRVRERDDKDFVLTALAWAQIALAVPEAMSPDEYRMLTGWARYFWAECPVWQHDYYTD